MSDKTYGKTLSKTVISDCKKGVVKSLILEFEQFKINKKTENAGMLRMGADQSTLTKPQGNARPTTISTSSLIKQRVTLFDHKLDSENQNDNKKRHKSITENNKLKVNATIDFQRSKSYDYSRREKDRYSRARQVTPKINENPFKFDVPTQKTSDSNNNSPRRKSNRKKPIQETPINENKKDNKTILKSPQRETSEITKQNQNKEGYTETKVIKKDFDTKTSIRRPIRSVKSIKKIFEGAERKPSSIPIKTKTLSNSDTKPNNDDKVIGKTDNEVSEVVSEVLDDDKRSEKHVDKNTSKNTKQTLEKIEELNGVAEEFPGNNSEISCNCSEDEFSQIEDRFQEVEQTLKEIISRSNPNLYDEDGEVIFANEDLEDAENINVFVEKSQTDDELEDEFGKRSFNNSDTITVTEAYNRAGDELIFTTVAAVEHRSLSESFITTDSSDELSNSVEHICSTSEERNGTIQEEIDDYPGNAVQNNLYFAFTEVQDLEAAGTSSNRSTLYSSTTTNSSESLERYSKGESDEGVEIEREHNPVYEEIRLKDDVEIRSSSAGGHDRTMKTETIYDSFQNPRIAKVTNVNSKECVTKAESPIVEEAEPLDVCRSPSGLKPKKDYLIEELIDTEQKYIKHLEKVVWNYMPAITDEKLPPSLIGKSRYLFGNIKKIYNTTQSFYKALKLCGTDHEEIAKTFIKFKYLFELYPIYSKNKPRADQFLLGDFKDVVSAREQELNDRLGLASNLLTPIQRLGKYILFLEQIQKELSKKALPSDNIYKATQVVRKEMSRGNDYLAIDSIKDCPFSLLEQGSFVMRNKFTVIKPRKYEAVLFLFEEILVFTTVDPKDQERFVYKDSIRLDEIGIVTTENQPLAFMLRRFPSYKPSAKLVNEFEIEAKKEKEKKTWTEQIEKRLWEQLVKCKEKQKEMHNNQGKRTSVMDLPASSLRRKKPGYSSLPNERRKNPPKSIFYYKVDRDA